MKALLYIIAIIVVVSLHTEASESSVARVYIPLDPGVDRPVEVMGVPFYTSGPYPEILFSAITESYVLKHGKQVKGYDINLASLAGISLRCESAASGQKKLHITWDLSQADPKLVTKELIDGLLLCLEKTAGNKTVLYSKFIGFDAYEAYKKRVEAKFPQQTKAQKREDDARP